MGFPEKGFQRNTLPFPIPKEGSSGAGRSPREPQHLMPWLSPALGRAVGRKGSGKEEASPSQPDGAQGSLLPEWFLGLLLSGRHQGSAPGATSQAAGSAVSPASEDEKNCRMVLSRAGPATAVHSAWDDTGACRDHVPAHGDPQPAARGARRQPKQSTASYLSPQKCLAQGCRCTQPSRRCWHLRHRALGWFPAPQHPVCTLRWSLPGARPPEWGNGDGAGGTVPLGTCGR